MRDFEALQIGFQRHLDSEVELFAFERLNGFYDLAPIHLEGVGAVVANAMAEQEHDSVVRQAIQDVLGPRVVGRSVSFVPSRSERAIVSLLNNMHIVHKISRAIGTVRHDNPHHITSTTIKASAHSQTKTMRFSIVTFDNYFAFDARTKERRFNLAMSYHGFDALPARGNYDAEHFSASTISVMRRSWS